MGAAIVLALALFLAFILRDVLTTGGLPGLESRIFYSSEVYTRSVLATGALPHWNPFYFSGTPHFADAENLVLYPPALALRWLPVPEFMQWMVIVHVLIGVAGMVFLTRTVGAGWLGALVAALTFAAGGTVTSWLHHGHVLLLYCASWLPWALALAIRSTARSSLLPHLGLVAVMVLQFLAGYLQGTIYISAVIAAVFLFRVIYPERRESGLARWTPLAQFVVLTVVASGLAAFQLLPTLRLAAEAGRSSGVDYVAATQDAWRFDDLATLWLPFHGLTGEPVHRYLGDRTAYVGWLPTLMVPFAFTRRSFTALGGFFLVLVLAAVALALGDHLGLYRLHYALFPGLRVPGRALFIATIGLGVLGAVGLEQFVALCRSRNWRPMALPAVVGFGWAAASLAVGMTISAGTDAPMHGWPWLPILAVTLIGAVAMTAAIGRTRLVAVLSASFIVLDLGLFSADAVHAAPVPIGNYWATLPTVNNGRVVSTCWMDLGETLESRVSTVDGLANMYLRDYADWAYLVKTGDAPRAGVLVTKISGMDGTLPARRDLMDISSAATVVACGELKAPDMSERSRFRERYFVYDNQAARPRAFWTCGLEEFSRGEVMTRLVRQRYMSDGTLGMVYPISVKWSAGLTDSDRVAIEARYGLGAGESAGDTVRRYFMSNPEAPKLLTLAADPAADDTNGFDRATGRVPTVEPVDGVERADDREWLVGAHSCAARGTVNVILQDRADGKVAAEVDAPVDGDVYFNEPYFSERRPYVDGAPAEARKANLAFTAVPVKAGHHRVELRFVPTSFYAGAGISGLTLMCSLGAAWRTRHQNAHRA